ncbi:hypothetical protein Vadar_026373 [Vaccinium darrowii]|uniref:Uncharacterized protein n=1 Tax=Vaccinium darrowii TaxID=229202 RepID=A0ACB7XLC2_9ERIC|nr:hypothetical protein Vadar_026373 [Vaccinium darrowii]
MAMQINVVLYHCSEESHEENLSSEWYEKTFPKLIELTHMLKNLDSIDGRLININDNSVVIDDSLQQSIHTFKSLARAFLGSPTAQQALTTHTAIPPLCFSKKSERGPMTINSLTRVCNFLNISAQQRKLIRLSICPQVTQHQIWTGALEEILSGLKSEIELMGHHSPNKGVKIGQQIIYSCLKFLDAAVTYDPDSTSWMRPSPSKLNGSPVSHKWEDILEMFNDLMNCLRKEKEKLFHLPKLEVMKEGLLQIKDVVVDKNIGYRETRHQENVEVEICGGLYESGGKDRFCLCMGKILTSDKEKTVRSGVKQLDRALGLFKYVWETAGMKGDLDIQGHLWCVGAEETSVTYRGNRFFIHGIRF